MTTTTSRTRKRNPVDPDSAPFDVDEKPRRRARDEEDEFDDEDEVVEEKPRRRRAPQAEFSGEPRRSSSRRSLSDEDDEDDEPIRRKSTRAARDEEEDVDEEGEETIVLNFRKGAPVPSRGSSLFFKYKEDGEPQIVKFLDTEPTNQKMHWVRTANRQAVPCPETKDCPLCNIGVEQREQTVYPVLNLSEDKGTVQALTVNKSNYDTLVGFHTGKTTSPLTKLWYKVSRTKGAKKGGFQTYAYSFLPIKDRDLEEDWDINLDDAESALEAAEPLDFNKVFGAVTKRQLKEIASEIMDDRS